jgi:hypothetical protein
MQMSPLEVRGGPQISNKPNVFVLPAGADAGPKAIVACVSLERPNVVELEVHLPDVS